MINFIRITDINIGLFQEKIEEFFFKNKDSYNFFHPHGFSLNDFKREINGKARDMYIFMEEDSEFCGYGILRGWDEGYDMPSLGILISSDKRGKGYASLMMKYLHNVSKDRGAEKIRLTVYKENKRAISLYNKLGYVFSEKNDDELIGIKEL